ncbi:MAG: transglutaminase domain-containing protein [Treponema sp.]
MKKIIAAVTIGAALTLAYGVFSCSLPLENQSKTDGQKPQSPAAGKPPAAKGSEQKPDSSNPPALPPDAHNPPSSGNHSENKPQVENEKKQEFFKRMANAAMRFEKEVDVGDLHISCASVPDGEPEYKRLYRDFLTYLEAQNVFLFHMPADDAPAYAYKPEAEDEVAEYKLAYLVDAARAEADFPKITETFERYYAAVQESMSEAEAAYALYRELDKNVVYAVNNDSPYQRSPLGALLDGIGVCEDYSQCYRRLLQGVGIESRCLAGKDRAVPKVDDIAHMWNSVRIDGHWYNVDATWDDYEHADLYGRSHSDGTYFLTSNDRFYGALNHPLVYSLYQSLRPDANDTRYQSSSYVFRNGLYKSDPFYREGYWYYFSYLYRSICRSRFDGTDLQKLYTKRYRTNANPHNIAFGRDKMYFVDYDDAKPFSFAVYSIRYDGTDLQKLGAASSPDNPLKPDNDIPRAEASGVKALRVEVMLSKMKDAYYHGSEDYFAPERQERKDFVSAIAAAESLLAAPAPDAAEAGRLCSRLRTLRAGVMERTRDK